MFKQAFTLAEGRPACTTTWETAQFNGNEMLKQVQHDGKETAKGEQQSLHSLLPLGEDGHSPDEGADVVRSYTRETAKEVRSTVKNTLAPWGEGKGEGLKNVTPHEAAEPTSCKFLITQSLSHLITSQKTAFTLAEGRPACTTTQVAAKAAFTLAEVLIALAVIGIVAALTLPGLIQNHNEKAWSTAKDLWEKKLTETVRRMNTDGVMTGHDTTEDFMDTFKQYMKVIKTCDNNDLNKCYSPEFVLTGKRDNLEKKYIEDFKTANDLGVSDWNTNTMSFVISDGTTVIAAYNPNCPYADPIEDTGSQVACLSMMVDVNGKKSPNRVGKDILLSNATISTCDNPIGDLCFSTSSRIEKINTCDGTSPYDQNFTFDIAGNACENNYWGGAVKACSDKNMELPTGAQLATLANNLYVDSNGDPINIDAYGGKSNLKIKDEFKDNPPISLGDYWSNEEEFATMGRTRSFSNSSSWGNGSTSKHNSAVSNVICISN